MARLLAQPDPAGRPSIWETSTRQLDSPADALPQGRKRVLTTDVVRRANDTVVTNRRNAPVKRGKR